MLQRVILWRRLYCTIGICRNDFSTVSDWVSAIARLVEQDEHRVSVNALSCSNRQESSLATCIFSSHQVGEYPTSSIVEVINDGSTSIACISCRCDGNGKLHRHSRERPKLSVIRVTYLKGRALRRTNRSQRIMTSSLPNYSWIRLGREWG